MVAKWAGVLTIKYMMSECVVYVDLGLHNVVIQQASNDNRTVHNWAEDSLESLLNGFNHILPLPPLPPPPRLYLGPNSRLASRNHSHRYPLVVR